MKETDDKQKIQGNVDPVTRWEGEKKRERERVSWGRKEGKGRQELGYRALQYSRIPQSTCCQEEYLLRSVLLFPSDYILNFSEWHLGDKETIYLSDWEVRKLASRHIRFPE